MKVGRSAGGRGREAQRQSALVAAIFAPHTDEAAQRGIEAYRANAQALADRALGAAFPNVRTLLGEEDFAHLAAEYWRAEPPQRGDVGVWGGGFADWLAAHVQLHAWPYLADCARLDFALHCCERAADAQFDAASLSLLSQADPAALRLELMPGCALIESPWPIVAIQRAHASGSDADFDAARAAIESKQMENAFVFREGWRARVAELDVAGAAWVRDVLAGASLATALDRAREGFDFAAWLAQAIERRWLKGVGRIVD